MCIIVYKPTGETVNRSTMAVCFENNPDGAGFMYPCENRVLIQKGFFTFDAFWHAWEKTHKMYGDSLPVVFHFRISTAGKVDKVNCHPHRITHDLAFVHNGILSCINVPKESRHSDTIMYRNRHLKGMIGRSLHSSQKLDSISKHIGKYNKFAFINGKGDVAICNEDQGVWVDGLWYSNETYKARLYSWAIYEKEDVCEYCGEPLATAVEQHEGLCEACLEYYYGDTVTICAGCDLPLFSDVSKQLGWCDDCGYEIYGKKWVDMLAATALEMKANDEQYT